MFYFQGYNLLLVVDDIEKQIVVLPEETRWVTIEPVKHKYFFLRKIVISLPMIGFAHA